MFVTGMASWTPASNASDQSWLIQSINIHCDKHKRNNDHKHLVLYTIASIDTAHKLPNVIKLIQV